MLPSRVSRFGSWLTAVLVLTCALCHALGPPIPPAPARHFNDEAGFVDAGTARRLDMRLEAFEAQTSNQVLVMIFPRLPEGTYVEDYTVKCAQAWGAGGKKRDNGVILFVFAAEHKLRIEVGYGLEGALPDSVCKSIISNVIGPQFKAGNNAQGLERGIEAIISATKNEYQGMPAAGGLTSNWASNHLWWIIGLVVVFLIWIHLGDTVFQRTGRIVVWNIFDVLRLMLLSGGSGGRFGGGGGGGGGGFHGGGGRFGGGGASGDW